MTYQQERRPAATRMRGQQWEGSASSSYPRTANMSPALCHPVETLLLWLFVFWGSGRGSQ